VVASSRQPELSISRWKACSANVIIMAGCHSVVVANCRLWLCYRFWWWWNEEVAEEVRYKKIKYGKWKKENTEQARMEYKKSRQNAKRVISSAKEKKQNNNNNNDRLTAFDPGQPG